ncbi:hypothetical protein T459_19197 [Capsicum annuum]|uniref:Uncharacterized protein n=1 Tax=Capsicum annuum TaxID=4072 RepID=A0A2G2Z1C8_CAPAN|nr:hypothetical protein T459_19197 [Capsicum annuum]
MGSIESTLAYGPVYFNTQPNLQLSLTDVNILHALTLNVKTHGYDYAPGSELIELSYRIYYRLLSTLNPRSSYASECSSFRAKANCNYHDDAGLGQKNSFEQSPAVTACYHDDAGFKQQKTSFVKDFEQRPTATSYRDNEADLEQEKSFEPRPTVTSYYHDDVGLKQEKSSFTKEFEPRPTATSYRDNEASLKNEKSFEPRSNVKCVA